MATGENLTGLEQYRPLLDAGAVGVVQAGCVWGITHFLRVATLALAHDLPISPVGFHGNVLAHAATAVPNHLVCELQDLASPIGITVDQTIEDGGVRLGDAPGLGIEIDEEAIGSQHDLVVLGRPGRSARAPARRRPAPRRPLERDPPRTELGALMNATPVIEIARGAVILAVTAATSRARRLTRWMPAARRRPSAPRRAG